MLEDKIEDSLDNPSLLKGRSVSPGNKDQKQKQYLYSLKQKFINSLAKLQSAQTRQIALLEIRRIMDKNRQPEYIRMYLALMKSLKIQGTTSSTKEHQILIFSHMCEIFKQNLLDPLDKPPSRIKTVFRIIEMLHSYFTDPSNTVQQACAKVLIDLCKHVLGTQSQNNNIQAETVINLVFVPLASILKNGVDKGSQATAALCINQLIQYWRSSQNNSLYMKILKDISQQMLLVSLKLNCQYHDFFQALAMLIEIEGLNFFGQKMSQFVSKMLGVINRLHKNNETTNFNSYMCKVNVCIILQKIGILIKDNPQLKRRLDDLDVLPSLQKANRNRIIQVQMAANKAIKIWNGQQIPQQVSKSPSKSRGSVLSLQNARNQKKRRSTSREEKVHMQKQLNHMKQDLQQMVKGGWGAHQRANNYVKKNTGVGGGNCSKVDRSPQNKAGKSHKQQIQALRKYIKQNSSKYGQDDKFIFYEEKNHKKRSASPKQFNNRPQTSKTAPKETAKDKKKYINQDSIDFQLEQNQGDQGAMLPQQSSLPRNPYADINQKPKLAKIQKSVKRKGSKALSKNSEFQSNLPQISMHQSELNELEQRQQQLIQWGKSKLQQKPNQFQQFQMISKKQMPQPRQSSFNKYSKKLQNNSRYYKQSQSKYSDMMMKKSLTLQQLEDMSSNMADLLNESDFKALEGRQSLNNQQILDLLQIPQQKKLEKFSNKHPQVQESHVSLAISQSKHVQKNRKPQNNQFTLNPSKHPSRLDNYSQIQTQKHEEQIEELIQAEDFHQTNHQYKGTSQIPVKNPRFSNKQNIQELYRKTVDHGQDIENLGKNRKSRVNNVNQQNQIYQQMIKNPPRSIISHTADHAQNFKELKSHQSASQNQIHPQIDNITEQWEKILALVQEQQFNEAYSLVFQMEDHIYLLRLMLITQVPLKKLTPTNVSLLWEKFLAIYKHKFIDQVFVQMFTTANQLQGNRGIKSCLSVEQTNDLLVELYQLSGRAKGKLSFNAAVLYNQIDQSINAHRN